MFPLSSGIRREQQVLGGWGEDVGSGLMNQDEMLVKRPRGDEQPAVASSSGVQPG